MKTCRKYSETYVWMTYIYSTWVKNLDMWIAKHWSILKKAILFCMWYCECFLFLPALKEGLFSSWVTASTTASMLLPPPRRTAYPARAAKHTPDVDFSDLSFGICPAPPWTTTTGNISDTSEGNEDRGQRNVGGLDQSIWWFER